VGQAPVNLITKAAQPALLRAPPFPGLPVRMSADSGSETTDAEGFALVRAARVGGAFWAAPAGLTAPVTIVIRPASAAEAQELVGTFDAATLADALWIIPATASRHCLHKFAALVARHGGKLRADVDPALLFTAMTNGLRWRGLPGWARKSFRRAGMARRAMMQPRLMPSPIAP